MPRSHVTSPRSKRVLLFTVASATLILFILFYNFSAGTSPQKNRNTERRSSPSSSSASPSGFSRYRQNAGKRIETAAAAAAVGSKNNNKEENDDDNVRREAGDDEQGEPDSPATTSSSSVRMITRITARTGRVDDVLLAVSALRHAALRDEPDCLAFEILQTKGSAANIVLNMVRCVCVCVCFG